MFLRSCSVSSYNHLYIPNPYYCCLLTTHNYISVFNRLTTQLYANIYTYNYIYIYILTSVCVRVHRCVKRKASRNHLP